MIHVKENKNYVLIPSPIRESIRRNIKQTDEHNARISRNHVGMLGKHHTADTKNKQSAAVKGRKMYNNGSDQKFFFSGEEPEGWIRGRIKINDLDLSVSSARGTHYYTDGVTNIRIKEGESIPDGFARGRTLTK